MEEENEIDFATGLPNTIVGSALARVSRFKSSLLCGIEQARAPHLRVFI